ncbi:MAG: T9SS C-terminal target domain-containing protein [Ignavibacteriae bacterium]|nr:MAG: T9SS C-terminal target domain-containing protein [Ignavibacteriota bacterium]
MKKSLYFFIFAILLSSLINISFSQSGWFWQNPLPQGNELTCVKYLPGEIIYAGSKYGLLMKSTNGGINWSFLNIPNVTRINSMSFINASTGWILTNEASPKGIYYTSNGGLTWFARPTGDTLYTGYAMSFINSSIGFVIGSEKIYKTTNGGLNWYNSYSNFDESFSGIYCINEQVIYISSANGYFAGKVFKSTDGGQSWQSTTFGYCVDDIYFLNSQTGFILTSNCIVRTTNSGNNWSTIYSGPSYTYFRRFISSGSQDIFACGNSPDAEGFMTGCIAKSTNSGANWSLTGFGFIGSYTSISFEDNLHGVAVGSFGAMYKTNDNGLTWNKIYYGYNRELCSITFANENTGCASGYSGKIFRTTNGGNYWDTSITLNAANLKTIKFAGESTVYAAGDDSVHGLLYKSTNNGANWNLISSGVYTPFTSMCWINENSGYISCSDGNVIKTTNGGSNFSALPTGLSNINSISFVDNNTGYCIKNAGHAVKTTNGGNNWIAINNVTGSLVYFINASTGFVKYSDWTNDIIYKTINGGGTWSSTSAYTGINDIKFFNESTGYYTCNGGIFCKTTNGGINWIRKILNTNNDINSLAIINGNVLYLAGFGGTIMKTTTGGEPIGVKNITTSIPVKSYLYQNYPNPFNPATKIKFSIPQQKSPLEGGMGGDFVQLKIYDVLGKEIAVLVNESLSPGIYEVEWNANDYPSGVYFYRLIGDGFTQTNRMILVK